MDSVSRQLFQYVAANFKILCTAKLSLIELLEINTNTYQFYLKIIAEISRMLLDVT